MTQTAPNLPQLGLTLFSLTLEMREPDYTLEGMIKRAAELDLGPGLEMVGFQSLRGGRIWTTPPSATSRPGRGQRLHADRDDCNLDLARNRSRWMDEPEGLAYLEAQITSRQAPRLPDRQVGDHHNRVVCAEARGDLRPARDEVRSRAALPRIRRQPEHPRAARDLREAGQSVDRLGSPTSAPRCTASPSLLAAHRESGMPEELAQFASEVWNSDTTMPEKFAAFAQEAPKLGAYAGGHGQARHDPDHARRVWIAALVGIMDRVVHVHAKFYGLDEQRR